MDKNALLAKYGAMVEVARNLPSNLEYKALARIIMALMTSKPAEYIEVAKRATLEEWLDSNGNVDYFFAILHYDNALKDLEE